MLLLLRRLAIAGSLLAPLFLLSGPVTAQGPQTWTFPSGACAGTLQDCIDAASPGDTIKIATDTPIDEFADIQKSLILRAAPGFHPTVSFGGAIYAPGPTMTVVVRDITFGDGFQANFDNGSGHAVTFKNLRVINLSGSDESGLQVNASVPFSADFIGNFVRMTGHQSPQIDVHTSHSAGDAAIRIIGNKLSGAGPSTGGGGIDLVFSDAGTVHADVYNNAIWNAAGCFCGGESGIFIDPEDTVQAHVNVVGNTFDHVHSNAIGVDDEIVTGGHLVLNVFDNVITNSDDSAISMEHTNGDVFTYAGGYNDTFGNGRASFFDGHSAGPANLRLDPRYRSAGARDYRLKSTSPLIDKGLVCTPGGLSNLDAAGRSRLAGPTVDMGAYEFGSGPETGRAFVGGFGNDMLLGTSGADIICGLGGGDFIDGEGGNDYVNGGAGADFVLGGPGSDRVFGGPGNDTVCGRDHVNGNDRVDGGTGNDGYRADPGDVLLHVEHTASCQVAS